MKIAKKTRYLIDTKDYATASRLHDTIFYILNKESGMTINFNNINQLVTDQSYSDLVYKVNKYVKPTLPIVNQNFQWTCVSDDVFNNLNNSFLIPSTIFCKYTSKILLILINFVSY